MSRQPLARAVFVVGMSLLLIGGPIVSTVGAVDGGPSGPAVSDTLDETAQQTAQTSNQSSNETSDLPVEPPTSQPLPSYEEVRKPNDTEAKIELGKKLFFDPRLSDTGSISCNTCHNVMEGGDGSRTVGRGVHGQTGPRNSPTVWNAVFMSTQFWDGRADSLEEQAKGPITAGVEMGMPTSEAAMEKIRNNEGYVEMYEEVYGGEDPVTLNNTVDAIAAYERTLITPNSSYDRYVRGDEDALTERQLNGMETFKELGCQGCHSGPAFNGPQWQQENGNGYYQKLGVYQGSNPQCDQYIEQYNLYADAGRADVTGDSSDEHMFKVPTLRNVEHTAPYFHNGQVRTLENATRVMASCQVGQNISDQQAENVTAFMTSLTGQYPEQQMPRLPSRSGGEPMLPADAGEASAPDSGDDTASVGTPAETAASQQTAEPQQAGVSGGSSDGSSPTSAAAFMMAAALIIALLAVAYAQRKR